jgi:hypothetical protein
MSAGWRQYQQEVADVFRAMGFKTTVEETLTGARASHIVDVAVRFRIGGVAVLWVVECKLWKASVRKEQVMTLVHIAQDVGADRAFLLSESGFQAGALTAVRNTSTTLTDLQGLLAAAEENIRWRLLGELGTQKAQLEDHLRSHLFDADGESPSLRTTDLDEVATLLGACFDMGLAITNALAERYPIRLSGLVADDQRVFAHTRDLITALEHDLAEVSNRAANLDAETRVRQAEILGRASRLAAEIEALVEAGDATFELSFDDPSRDTSLVQCLTPMKAIGDLIENLRPFLGPKLFAQVRTLRQDLIDGVYQVLATPAADRAAWRIHAEKARQGASDLRSAFASTQGPTLPG